MANSTLERIRQKITLDRRNGWIAGVCAGVADYIDTDPAFVRVTVVISALFMPKITTAAYLLAWLLLDDERKL